MPYLTPFNSQTVLVHTNTVNRSWGNERDVYILPSPDFRTHMYLPKMTFVLWHLDSSAIHPIKIFISPFSLFIDNSYHTKSYRVSCANLPLFYARIYFLLFFSPSSFIPSCVCACLVCNVNEIKIPVEYNVTLRTILCNFMSLKWHFHNIFHNKSQIQKHLNLSVLLLRIRSFEAFRLLSEFL